MMRWPAWRHVATAISLCVSAGLAQDDAPSTGTFLRRTNARGEFDAFLGSSQRRNLTDSAR